jgi:hypothetical protein
MSDKRANFNLKNRLKNALKHSVEALGHVVPSWVACTLCKLDRRLTLLISEEITLDCVSLKNRVMDS